MRIIGGELKGRIFKPGRNFKARPTTDFAKENLFNILNNKIDFEETKILDLFAGTGSISFEFASRGCQSITTVEIDHVHFAFISSVIKQLKLEENIRLLRYDVLKFIPSCTETYDLIFADPPYEMKSLKDIPDLIFSNKLINPGGMLILEHGKTDNFASHPNLNQQRVYGSVHFSFFQS